MDTRGAALCTVLVKRCTSAKGLCEKPAVSCRVFNAMTAVAVGLVRGFFQHHRASHFKALSRSAYNRYGEIRGVLMAALYDRRVQITSSGSALRRIGRLLQPMPRPTIRVPRPGTSKRPCP